MAPSRTAESHWDDVLRAYAAVLDEHRALLLGIGADTVMETEVLIVPPFVPPANMPPLPASMLGRIRALERETAGLIAVATEYLDRNRPAVGARPVRLEAGSGALASVVIDRKL